MGAALTPDGCVMCAGRGDCARLQQHTRHGAPVCDSRARAAHQRAVRASPWRGTMIVVVHLMHLSRAPPQSWVGHALGKGGNVCATMCATPAALQPYTQAFPLRSVWLRLILPACGNHSGRLRDAGLALVLCQRGAAAGETGLLVGCQWGPAGHTDGAGRVYGDLDLGAGVAG